MNRSGVSTDIELEDFATACAEREAEEAQRNKRLQKLGIFTPDRLSESVKKDAKKPFLIEGLLRSGSVNLLIGDSGLGKTPLAIQMAACVVAGLPIFGRSVQKGKVLYCDAESGKFEFDETLNTVATFLGLERPPDAFHVWSPNSESGPTPSEYSWRPNWSPVKDRVDAVEPVFVIVDAFRTFWPEAETKSKLAAEALAAFKKTKGVTWLLLHHRRKVNAELAIGDLVENPQMRFQESAGSLALVNQSDTRIGVEPHPGKEADLLMAGFLRGSGAIVPLDVAGSLMTMGTQLVTGC